MLSMRTAVEESMPSTLWKHYEDRQCLAGSDLPCAVMVLDGIGDMARYEAMACVSCICVASRGFCRGWTCLYLYKELSKTFRVQVLAVDGSDQRLVGHNG